MAPRSGKRASPTGRPRPRSLASGPRLGSAPISAGKFSRAWRVGLSHYLIQKIQKMRSHKCLISLNRQDAFSMVVFWIHRDSRAPAGYPFLGSGRGTPLHGGGPERLAPPHVEGDGGRDLLARLAADGLHAGAAVADTAGGAWASRAMATPRFGPRRDTHSRIRRRRAGLPEDRRRRMDDRGCD